MPFNKRLKVFDGKEGPATDLRYSRPTPFVDQVTKRSARKRKGLRGFVVVQEQL